MSVFHFVKHDLTAAFPGSHDLLVWRYSTAKSDKSEILEDFRLIHSAHYLMRGMDNN